MSSPIGGLRKSGCEITGGNIAAVHINIWKLEQVKMVNATTAAVAVVITPSIKALFTKLASTV
ncbi:hypothetical protein GCM10023156_30280 [Novipirellula rosea]|uniref:Uncharacterized protein n=1 Tax=Novipirellula rosea TaxID=1031540 RepID=A0ABP8MUU3_9BACT